jgi:hypothetical protein
MTRFAFAAACSFACFFAAVGTASAQSVDPFQPSWVGTPFRAAVDPLEPLADAFPAVKPLPTPAPRSYYVASGFWTDANRVVVEVQRGHETVVIQHSSPAVAVEQARLAYVMTGVGVGTREVVIRPGLPRRLDVRLLTTPIE